MKVFYLVLLFVIIINSFPSKNEKSYRIKLIISLLAITLMESLRVGWGPDYYNYENSFISGNFLLDGKGEIGFRLLQSIMPSYRMLLVVAALWYSVGLYILFTDYVPTKYWRLAFILLFLAPTAILGNMTGLRTGIALVFLILAIRSLDNGRRLLFIVYIIAGSLFHFSLIVFMLLFFVPKGISRTKKSIVFVAFIILALLSAIVPQVWLQLVNELINYVDPFEKYSYYMEDFELSSGRRGLSYVLLFYLLYEVLLCLEKTDLTKSHYLLVRLSLLWFFLSCSPAIGLSARFYYYLDVIFICAMIIVLSHRKNSISRILIIAALLLYYGLQHYIFYHSSIFNEFWREYHSILE